MAQHNDFGKEAELAATDFLIKNGYKIIAQNYRYLKAEVDIIARIENTIVIVEVKARSTDIFINPEEAVTKAKIKLLISAADHFVQDIKEDLEVRFDIISVLLEKDKSLKINHIPDAFHSFDGN